MTEPWLEDEQVAAATCATVAKASPGLRTYSERRRHSRYARGSCVCYTESVQQNQAKVCCRASADNSGDSTAVVFPYSAPNPSRPSYTQPFHPFFSHCSLQGPKPTQQKSSKRSFTQLHLDAGQVSTASFPIRCVTCNQANSPADCKPLSVLSLFSSVCLWCRPTLHASPAVSAA